MTEPVRDRLLTLHTLRLAPRGCAALVAASLASSSAMIVAPALAHAALTDASAAPADDPAEPTTEPEAELPSESAIRGALEDGDLTAARELAEARSEGEPSVANFRLEAEVWLALGDYEQARAAYAEALEALGDDASDEREAIEAELAELDDASRGAKADEPASEHRERFDEERGARLAALAPKPPPPPVIVDTPTREPIVKKWYFWVTLGAIVASAGAIAGIALASALDEGADADASAAASLAARPPSGGFVLRF